jgi:hypothetical protein
MASVVDKSLAQQVEQVDAETRFLMLSTIREYALERLVESNDELAARRAHAAYYLVLAEEGAEDMVAHPEWLDRFEVEHDNFRTALDYLIRTGMPNGAFATAPSCFASGKRGNISRRAVMLSPGSSRWKGPRRVRSSVPSGCSLPRFWRASRAITVLRGNCSKKVSSPVSNSTITAALPSH